MDSPLTNKELELMNAYWRACNYLSVGMIYLKDNPLLKEPLKPEHVKHRLHQRHRCRQTEASVICHHGRGDHSQRQGCRHG